MIFVAELPHVVLLWLDLLIVTDVTPGFRKLTHILNGHCKRRALINGRLANQLAYWEPQTFEPCSYPR